ncbi:PREDICTED: uncharacterized protein LOC108364321 [Rhagoletis zephyria]|uniref:uncharacterized protein LOC108364321 n=1 Tax=Rhagoletis zephyria TaxID=28612 RepID=UPI0008113FC8|nr:PREDICTED: uncharacterized protein LOC108364321 [Rhagoletis zephyria]
MHEKVTATKSQSTYLYRSKSAKWDVFDEVLTQHLHGLDVLNTDFDNITPDGLDNVIEKVVKAITNACHISMRKRKAGKTYNPWWNDELQTLKNKCIKLHHKMNSLAKANKPVDIIANEHAAAKKVYAQAPRLATNKKKKMFGP